MAEKQQILQFSDESIELKLEGNTAEGSFTMEGTEGAVIKGYISCPDSRMFYGETRFEGEKIEVGYCFDGTSVLEGETVSGCIAVVSNCGEYEVPFTATREKKILDSSMGEIRNLFHFTNLARTNWEEAVKLFFTPEFKYILTGNDREYMDIYRGLSVKVKEQYVEEFLRAVRKKNAVSYTVENEELFLENISERYKEELEIKRTSWGYTRIRIEAEGDFLEIEKDFLREEDFMGNVCRVPFYVNPDKLHQGKNWGRISLIHPYGNTQVTILVHQCQHHRMKIAIEKRRKCKKYNHLLTGLYVDFRCKKLAPERWKKDTEGILENLRKIDERNPLVKLFEAHIHINQEKFHEAKWLLDRAIRNISEEKDPVSYAYYLYLSGFLAEGEEYVQQIGEKVEELYYCNEDSWQIAWIFMYLSTELHTRAEKRWNFLKQVFQKGCTSPVMYAEAVLLLNYQPTLLMELGETELRILWFGQKKEMLSDEVKGILQYLSMKEKEYSWNICNLLMAVCSQDGDPQLLQSLCRLLIKGNKTGSMYFPWYEKAVTAGLKITRLYEYYMMSMDWEKKADIPRRVLMYFSYQSELSYEYAACLYRYIYENREQMQDLYLAYAPGIERFLIKQLYAGKIDRNLGYLYQHILLSQMLTEDNACQLAGLMFTYEADRKEAKGEKIVVIHKPLKEEEIYEGSGDGTRIQLYTKSYSLFWEDKWGNRFVWDQEQRPRPFLNVKKAAGQIRTFAKEDTGLALHCCSSARDWQTITRENEGHFLYLSQCDEIREEEKQDIRIQLLDYYYDEDEMERLDCRLEEYFPDSVKKEDRKKLVHYMVVRGYYEKAYRFIQNYGPENMAPKALVRICSYMLEEEYQEDILLWYIYTAFRKGKYNAAMLEYLVAHYRGTSKIMRDIFQAAEDFDVDTYAISERILKQILYSKAYIGNEAQVFRKYVSGGAKTPLEAAFLLYCAKGYMVEDKMIDGYLVKDIARVHRRGVKLPMVTHLAYLRYFAENEKERQDADEELIGEFLQEVLFEKELLLPFLQEYQNRPGMEALADKTLVSYKTTPGSRVVLHYIRNYGEEREEAFQREEMKEVYAGVFVKDFILFFGEEIQYYITEEQENKEQLTQSGTIQKEESAQAAAQSRYQMIHEMAIGQTLEDYQTVDSLLEEYWKIEFVTDQVFQL